MKKRVFQSCALASLAFAAAVTVALASRVLAMTPPGERARQTTFRRIPGEPELPEDLELYLAVFGEDRQSEALRLEDSWGVAVGTVYLTQGRGMVGALAPGSYRLIGRAGTAAFSLSETGAVRRLSGPCWTTGTDLHYGQIRGSVTISCPSTPWATAYYYDLVGEGSLYGLTVRYDPRDPLSGTGTIFGLEPGTYRVLEAGQDRGACTVTPENPTCRIDGRAWPAAPGR